MPKMDGYESAQKIRELEKRYGVPERNRQFICGYSANVSLRKYHLFYSTIYLFCTDVEKECFEHGMDDVCAKNMEFKALQRMLQQHDHRKNRNTSTSQSQSVSGQGKNTSPISDQRLSMSPMGQIFITDNQNAQT